MKYAIITYTIRDGEYEYMTQTPSMGKTVQSAKNIVLKDAKDWIKNDYRELDDISSQEISKEEFDIIKKYIY